MGWHISWLMVDGWELRVSEIKRQDVCGKKMGHELQGFGDKKMETKRLGPAEIGLKRCGRTR